MICNQSKITFSAHTLHFNSCLHLLEIRKKVTQSLFLQGAFEKYSNLFGKEGVDGFVTTVDKKVLKRFQMERNSVVCFCLNPSYPESSKHYKG